MLRTSSAAALAALWMSLSVSSIDAAGNNKMMHGIINNKKIPLDSGRDWISFPDGTEFQPSQDTDPRLENLRRHLGYSSNNGNAMSTPYIDGSETYYDEYAQAWRALGWYIDCNGCGDDDDNNGNGMGSCIAAADNDGDNENGDRKSVV